MVCLIYKTNNHTSVKKIRMSSRPRENVPRKQKHPPTLVVLDQFLLDC